MDWLSERCRNVAARGRLDERGKATCSRWWVSGAGRRGAAAWTRRGGESDISTGPRAGHEYPADFRLTLK